MLVLMNTRQEPFAWVDWMIAERQKQGMTQADLARKTGLTRTTISDYEKRIRPNPAMDSLVRISVALGFSPDYLPRLAGELPTDPDSDPWVDQMTYKMKKIRPNLRDVAERFINSMLESDDAEQPKPKRESRAKSKPKQKTRSSTP